MSQSESQQTQAVAEFTRLCGPEHQADPHPWLAWVRHNMPVLRTPNGDYALTTYAACRQAYDPVLFRAPEGALFPGSEKSRTRELLSRVITVQNPPAHTRLRGIFTRDFTVRRVAGIQPATAALCERLLDSVEEPLRDGATVDMIQLVRSLPLNVVAEHVGIPAQDRMALFSNVPVILAAIAPTADDATLAAGDAASVEVEAYYRDLVEQRRAHPAGDVTSAWVAAGERLSFDELMSMLWGMIAGGLGTTIAALGSGILALLRYPDQAGWVERAPRVFAEEVLRHESPSFVGGVPKIAVNDIEIDGTLIPRGALVRTMITSACRDETVFADPDRFDPARDNSKSLAFGHGIHLCLGANLARMEITTLLPMLHRRFPALELADEPVWQAPQPIRGLATLPVRLHGSSTGATSSASPTG